MTHTGEEFRTRVSQCVGTYFALVCRIGLMFELGTPPPIYPSVSVSVSVSLVSHRSPRQVGFLSFVVSVSNTRYCTHFFRFREQYHPLSLFGLFFVFGSNTEAINTNVRLSIALSSLSFGVQVVVICASV